MANPFKNSKSPTFRSTVSRITRAPSSPNFARHSASSSLGAVDFCGCFFADQFTRGFSLFYLNERGGIKRKKEGE